ALRHERHVADAAEVLREPHAVLRTKAQPVPPGHERRALSSCRDVADAEVRDDRKPRALRDHTRLGDLQRGTAVPCMTRKVDDRLAVASYEVHVLRRETRLCDDGERR